jgi:hypothetical protein
MAHGKRQLDLRSEISHGACRSRVESVRIYGHGWRNAIGSGERLQVAPCNDASRRIRGYTGSTPTVSGSSARTNGSSMAQRGVLSILLSIEHRRKIIGFRSSRRCPSNYHVSRITAWSIQPLDSRQVLVRRSESWCASAVTRRKTASPASDRAHPARHFRLPAVTSARAIFPIFTSA